MSERPTRAELAAAAGRTLPDLWAPGVRLMLVGINPGLWSAAIGHHFGNPANRMWPALHLSGFTPRRLHPTESAELLGLGIGITNLVMRATATAAELSADEIRAGAVVLIEKLLGWQPAWVAFLGLSSYRVAFDRPKATVGRQPDDIAGAKVWLLPNTSGLNAHYQLPDLVAAFTELRHALVTTKGRPNGRPFVFGAS
ncbi:MAG: G/U mismatch-specific DNA glycosylase [Mycobacteriales bacterium]